MKQVESVQRELWSVSNIAARYGVEASTVERWWQDRELPDLAQKRPRRWWSDEVTREREKVSDGRKKLSDQDALDIIRKVKEGGRGTQSRMAIEYGVSSGCISGICNGKRRLKS